MTSTALASLRADAVSDWEACGETFYCQEHLYDLNWADVDLSVQRIAAAPFGGPIAVTRKESALVVIKPGSAPGGRPVVRIFSSSGQLSGSFLWEGAQIAGWGWSGELELVMIDVAGKVFFYSLHGARIPKAVSFGQQLEAEGLSHVCMYSDGFVVMGASSCQLWAVTGLQEPRASKLPLIPGLGAAAAGTATVGSVSCIAVLEPRFTLSSGLEVLVAAGEMVWVVDDHGATDYPLPAGCGGVAAIAVSPNGAFLALSCNDGRLRVMSSDFSQQLSEFDSHSGVPPADVAWCGVDAVALRWEGLLLLVDPYGNWLKRACDEAVVMVSEVDGLRLVTSTSCSLLRRVPESLVQVYKPGSTAPSAQLLDARDLFDSGNARADKLLRQMAGEIQTAVQECATAAGLELSVTRQKALLRAAIFGRAFAQSMPAGLLKDLTIKLRVLNALRDHDVGLPLTMPQLEALTLHVVVHRLVIMRQHLLAFRIAAEALGGVGKQEVLLHWAAAKISASPSVPDDKLKQEIAVKMNLIERPRYAHLAAHAQSIGRRSLAIQLLQEEPSAAHQVPLLISLAKSTGALDQDASEDPLARALRKAVESGDPDLVYLSLFAAYRSRALPEFWKLVSPRAPSRNLFVKYTKVKEPELLETIYTTNQMHQECADLALDRAFRAFSSSSSHYSSSALSSANGFIRPSDEEVTKCISGLQTAAKEYGQCRDAVWQSKAASEAALLLKEQLRLERDTGQALFVGLSLASMIQTCLRLGHHKHAANLRKQFSVPDARWYWLKISALAAAHDWEGLDVFAGERKSPIGFEAFLEVAQKHSAPREVMLRLISRMPDSRAKADAFEAIACPREAAEVAAKLRDLDLFARIQNAVSANSPAGLAIAQIKERFQSR